MVTVRMLILNNKGHLLVTADGNYLRIPYKVCMSDESYESLEEAASMCLRNDFNIEDIRPTDFYLYYMSNHIENNELFLNITYRGNSKIHKLTNQNLSARFLELREVKKNIDLFTDLEDQQVIRRFIIREDNPTLL